MAGWGEEGGQAGDLSSFATSLSLIGVYLSPPHAAKAITVGSHSKTEPVEARSLGTGVRHTSGSWAEEAEFLCV